MINTMTTVGAMAAPPVARAGDDRVVTVGDEVVLNASGSEAFTPATITSYSWTQTIGASVELLNSSTPIASFVAEEESLGLEFLLVVTDSNGLTHTDSVTIEVELPAIPEGTPPTAIAGLNKVVTSGDSVTLDGTSSEQGFGSIVSYSWSQKEGTPVIISNASQSVASFKVPMVDTPETMEFELVVTDSLGLSSKSSVFIQVAAQRPFFINSSRDYSSAGGDGIWRDKLREGEVDSYTLSIDPSWVTPETIVSYTVTEPEGVEIVHHSLQENTIQVYLTAKTNGKYVIRFDYETASRSDRTLVTLDVVK